VQKVKQANRSAAEGEAEQPQGKKNDVHRSLQ
jgi:hypothetical protein